MFVARSPKSNPTPPNTLVTHDTADPYLSQPPDLPLPATNHRSFFQQLGHSESSHDDTFEGFTFVDNSSHLQQNSVRAASGRAAPATATPSSASIAAASAASPHARGGGAPARKAAAKAAAAAAVATATAAPMSVHPHPQQRLMVDAMDTPDI